MTMKSSLAPKGNSVLGFSATIALHAVLAILLVPQLHPPRPKFPPEPVPVKLLREAPARKPALKPLPAPVLSHPPVAQPVLVVPVLTVAEQSKPDLAKPERPNIVTLPPPSPAAPLPPEAEEPDFQSKLMAHLNRLKRYPADAKRQGKMGVVLVRFRIDRQGHMLAYHIEQGSGHAMLDEETTRLMQRADPFPAPPDSVPGTELEFLVPVQYKLG